MDAHEDKVSKISVSLHSDIQHQLTLLQTNSSGFNLHSILRSLNEFQPAPQLLDTKLREYINIVLSLYLDDYMNTSTSEIFYNIGKIVGYKKISTLMKTEIHLIPIILQRAQLGENLHWHERYLLGCWLLVLVLTPFKLDSMKTTIKTDIYSIAIGQLGQNGPLKPLGARLLGSLIMRTDCKEELSRFIEVLGNYTELNEGLKVGYLQTLNIALKRDLEDVLQPHAIQLAKFCKAIAENDKSKTNIEIVAKVFSKLARYLNDLEEFKEIEDIIDFFLENFNNRNTETRFILARKYAKLLINIESCLCIEATFDLLDQTEEMSNPEAFDNINADILHTNLLTIAESLRTRSSSSYHYEQITRIITKTLFFQQNRVTHIGGSNVRDASNFIAWSLAKYSTEKIKPELTLKIFQSLVCLSCFDKDIMIRRASAAALQELMGRHGSYAWATLYPDSKFNNGRNLCVANVLDYVELGSLEKSYLVMPAKLVLGFPELEPLFIDYLSLRSYDSDHEIVIIAGLALCQLISTKESEIQSQISKHIQIAKTSNNDIFNALLLLSELLKITSNHQRLPQIIPIFETVKIDHHKNSPFQMVACLSLFASLLKLSYQPSDQVLKNLFSSMRNDSSNIKQIIIQIAPFLNLNNDFWNEWLRFMKLGNQCTSSSVALLPQFKERCDLVLDLLSVEKINHLVKVGILKSVSTYLANGGHLDMKYFQLMFDCLDDYTITEQGDVGSTVRSQALSLLFDNWERIGVEFKDLFEIKLLRLAAEPIETIRFSSFELIERINGSDFIKIETEDKPFYFTRLLKTCSEYYLKDGKISSDATKEFWKGYASTGGALKSTDELITSSLSSFITFYNNSTERCQTRIILDILANLKIDSTQSQDIKSFKCQRIAKSIQTSAQFFSRALLCNLKLPQGFNIKGLYARVFNLHLNTTNLIKIKSSIEIFGYLAVVENFDDSLQRLRFLTVKHPLSKVRSIAAKELFSVYTELSLHEDTMKRVENLQEKINTLKTVDWTQSRDMEKYSALI